MEDLNIQQLTSKNLAKEAAEKIFYSLTETGFFIASKSFLLLSGGSCVDVAAELVLLLPTNLNLANITIGLADERWVEVGSPDSNEQQLRQKGVISRFEQKGAHFLPMLGEDDPETAAQKIDELYKEVISENTHVALLAGLGADGHTLGILPEKDSASFLQKFSSEKLVTYYELNSEQDNPFKKRLSLTLTGVSKMTHIYIYATGESKKSALRYLRQKDETVNIIPALGLYLIERQPTLFTDVLI